MPAFFSIVIPTYNRAHLIGNTIRSVLTQAYENFELIVVDDGSTDNTGDVVQQIINANPQRSISYYYKPNAERAAARNYGLKQAKGDYVIFFDSDDELYTNHLSEAERFVVSRPGVEVFHLRYDIKNGKKVKTSEGPIYSSPPNKDLIKGNFLSCNGMVLRRDVALANQFNEDRDLSAAEDWELWLRLSVKYPIHYVNTITSTIYNHEERSVLAVNKEKLVKRMELLISYVSNNKPVAEMYSSDLYRFRASCYSYISLHLALTRSYRAASINYLFKSIRVMPSFVLQKRFFGILKNLV